MDPLVFDHDAETVVGNGRLIARVRAGAAEFVFAGPSAGYRLLVDGAPVADRPTRTVVRPGRVRYVIAGCGAVTAAAQPDAALMVLLVEPDSDSAWTLELRGPEADAEGTGVDLARGEAVVWTRPPKAAAATQKSPTTGALHVSLAAGDRAAFLLGDEAAASAIGDPFVAVETWAAQTHSRGLRLRTPDPELDRAVEFAKAHLRLGYDWTPDANGQPGGEGSKMVCDIFRWRDVWSRDFGSGFGPGGLAAGLIGPVLATLDYEAERHAAHDPAGLKVSDDTSQGGSAEGLGWLLKLVWQVYQHTGDREWLRRMAEAFEPWVHEWVARDADEDGLIVDVTEWMDHSRFFRLPEGQRTLYSNALYLAALQRMTFVCDALGRDADAARYQALADRSRQSVHDTFWDEAGYFRNAVQWGVPDTTLMLADNALALAEGVASRDEALRTLDTLRARSWRAFGSVTTDLPIRYVPITNDHSERVWPWWMAHEATARFLYGDAEGGLHVLAHIVDTFHRPTLPGLCEEYLDPHDGSQDDVVGHAFITGSGAFLDAVQTGLLGVSVRAPGETHLQLAPAVPEDWTAWGADLDLAQGRLHVESAPQRLAVALDGTRVERLDLRIPSHATVRGASVNDEALEPGLFEDESGAFLSIDLEPGPRHEVAVRLAPKPTEDEAPRIPSRPPPTPITRIFLLDVNHWDLSRSPADLRVVEQHAGEVEAIDTGVLATLSGAGDLVAIAGNALPYRTEDGALVSDRIEGFVGRGGALLLLGPRFPRVDLEDTIHGGHQMGGHAGLFEWKVRSDRGWQDYDPREDRRLDHPEPKGAVYWGEGPLFAAWEHRLGLFGFETECQGILGVAGEPILPEVPVDVVYTDWTVRKPWTFTPLLFTERERQLITGPRRERYPCAALLEHEESHGRIVVISPAVVAQADVLARLLAHVAPT